MTKIKNFDEFLEETTYYDGSSLPPEHLMKDPKFIKDLNRLEALEETGRKRMDSVYNAQAAWEKKKEAMEKKYDMTIGYSWGDILA